MSSLLKIIDSALRPSPRPESPESVEKEGKQPRFPVITTPTPKDLGFPPRSNDDRILLDEGQRLDEYGGYEKVKINDQVCFHVFHTAVASPHTNLALPYNLWANHYLKPLKPSLSAETYNKPLIIGSRKKPEDKDNHPHYIPTQFVNWIILEVDNKLVPLDIYQLGWIVKHKSLPESTIREAGLNEDISISDGMIDTLWQTWNKVEAKSQEVLESIRQEIVDYISTELDIFPDQVQEWFEIKKYAVMGRTRQLGEAWLVGTGAQTVRPFHSHTTLVFKFWKVSDQRLIKRVINTLSINHWWHGSLEMVDSIKLMSLFCLSSLPRILNNLSEDDIQTVETSLKDYFSGLASADQVTLEGIKASIKTALEGNDSIPEDLDKKAQEVALSAFEPFYKNIDPWARYFRGLILSPLQVLIEKSSLSDYIDEIEEVVNQSISQEGLYRRFFVNQGLRVTLKKPIPIGSFYQQIGPALDSLNQAWRTVFHSFNDYHNSNEQKTKEAIIDLVANKVMAIIFPDTDQENKEILGNSIKQLITNLFRSLIPSDRQTPEYSLTIKKRFGIWQNIINSSSADLSLKIQAALELQLLEDYYRGYPLTPGASVFTSLELDARGLVKSFTIGPSLSKRSGAEVLLGTYIIRDRPKT